LRADLPATITGAVLDQHLDGDAGRGVGGEVGVEDAVGDEVGDLVGMAFGDRLGGEEVGGDEWSRTGPGGDGGLELWHSGWILS
jgi:hypothetical protein